ncbi:tRNA (adenosine(37)-N6)-threonylcarbamoyltransferase complex ATPase subunit type 1 TsaE [Croceitalea rosinachiae]|uniref:tRNA threonylcarbamoyladenosine biosynthesis protein TsaE n=1 Tax=Croceitalea rosinachiae TaxID=3075596 RepID=A0ABU3ABD5_9FLAO|nr:tRNA (adenosine(37)-N6)-threonylcarbamoyltransferase complex ATPase subunit type 1 TsaE [Croceitalea sp. F388]MDT0607479.1 tRNA (adenosine(37)-N6)-threonylcarbamoyltransferase complex ATPase subunit type 1 TsaE [Croceitalea sp. F388]
MPELYFNNSQLGVIAKKLLKEEKQKCFCFYGQMGVGKTTLIKNLLQELGAIDLGHSPTFGLVNEYDNAQNKLLAYHFDFYRIENEEEVYDMGIEEYFSQDAYIFIEWPEKIPNLIPKDALTIKLQFIDENTRRIEY